MTDKITIDVKPASRPGWFKAEANGVVLCVSRTPMLTAARRLMKMGPRSGTQLVMRRDGEVAMAADLQACSKLAVREGRQPPYFEPWKPFSSAACGSLAAD